MNTKILDNFIFNFIKLTETILKLEMHVHVIYAHSFLNIF